MTGGTPVDRAACYSDPDSGGDSTRCASVSYTGGRQHMALETALLPLKSECRLVLPYGRPSSAC